ncbi:cardiolipin synthase [Undibacterium sp.]|uniref:cardiolipin synthase n=1 Tax=Undibacterium sp. TaxID=1914977 RepID=UPI00374D7AB5
MTIAIKKTFSLMLHSGQALALGVLHSPASGWSRLLPLLALTFTLSACAGLPEVNYLGDTLSAKATPTVEGSKGTLPSGKASALLSKRWAKSPDNLKAVAALEEAATGEPLVAGNKVTLLLDGPQTMAAMIDAIGKAKDTINLETYIFDEDELGMRFANLLIEKQKAGVRVNIIYDCVGTLETPQEFFTNMRDAGIHLMPFNPVNPFKRFGHWDLNNRDHRKLLIVDGSVAFTGGVNISKVYSSSSFFRSGGNKSSSKAGWRDTHIRIEGPAVAALQLTFVEAWASQEQGDLPDQKFFPPLSPVGDKLVRVLASEPGGDFDIYKAYILAMQGAKKSIHITSAYFVPDVQMVQALSEAAQRGVDVKLVLPGVSDSGLVYHASRSFYEKLLQSGVKIYELQVSVLHAKTAVIDGAWSTVGSTNLDTRSFLHNRELNVIVLGDSFGDDMEKTFDGDLRGSKEVSKEEWEKRPVSDKLKEWAAMRMQYWL